jgi:SAM-dependent methyltransferase
VRFTGGLPETPCGAGSTIKNTASIRAVLPGLLRELGVRRLLDAPCGDCNWISQVDLGVEYIGCDYNPEHIERAKQVMSGQIVRRDIVAEALPSADLMLCRDFHQHLPNEMVLQAIDNFCRSGIWWLLATSHSSEVNEDITEVGGFRPINLSVAPFSFGFPVKQIPDAGRILGLWHRDSLGR